MDGREDGQRMDVVDVHNKGTMTHVRSHWMPKSGQNFPLSHDTSKLSILVTPGKNVIDSTVDFKQQKMYSLFSEV